MSWGVAPALLFSWVALAIINAFVLAALRTSWAPRKLPLRLAQHAYDAGHLLALGVATAVVAWVWCRFVPPRRGLAIIGFWLASTVIALGVMREDLTSSMQRYPLPYPLVCALAALALPGAWAIARYVGRTKLRWLLAVAAIALTVANHVVLPFNYPGLHLFTAGAAAFLLAGGLSTLPRPARAPRRWRRVLSMAGLIAIAVLAMASVVVTPNPTVWRELFRSSGTVLVPYLARWLPERRGEHRPLPLEGTPWFRDRSRIAAVPPSGSSPVPKDAVVVFLTVDALRADVVQKHAHDLPALDRLRRGAVEFASARTPSPSTVTTLVSVFTGKYYSALYWSALGGEGQFKDAVTPHADPSPRLPGMLAKAGIPSVHVVTLFGNAKALGGVGADFTEELVTKTDYGPADEAVTLLVERLRKQERGPLFAHLHLVDAHAPYNLAGTDGSDYECYVREVQLVDRALGRLLEFLDGHAIGRRTVLIFGADHGEAFGEHNTSYHALTVYEEVIRIPLYVRVPGVEHRVVSEPVTLMDVGPTVLDLYGQPTPGHFMGQSLVPFLSGGSPKLDRPIAVDAGRRMQALYFAGHKKAIIDIQRGTEEFYDLQKDPGELENLVGDETAHAARYLGAVRTFFEKQRLKREGYETPWRPF